MFYQYLEKLFRLKPSFLILGAQRSGTTSFYNYICRHPLVYAASKKEIHFFDYYYNYGLAWYNRNFPFRWRLKKNRITGEATPYYLFNPLVAARVKKDFPQMKFIVLLRNPVYRAYSHYQWNVSRSIEKNSFEEAISQESIRIRCDWDEVSKGNKELAFGHQNFSYLARGKYMDQIKKWLTLFPREQFLFIRSEVFFTDPQKTLNQVFDFLNVEQVSIKCSEIYNENRNKYFLDKNTEENIYRYYEKDNQELSAFLKDDFDWRINHE